jgi:hypothetical protein
MVFFHHCPLPFPYSYTFFYLIVIIYIPFFIGLQLPMHPKQKSFILHSCFLSFFLFAVLGVEFWVSHLLGKDSISWAIPPVLFAFIFQIRSYHFLPACLRPTSSYFCLLSSWSATPHPAKLFLKGSESKHARLCRPRGKIWVIMKVQIYITIKI